MFGRLLRVPNEMAEDWHQRRRICEAYREKQKELSRNPKSQQLEKEVRDWKARAEEASELGTLEVGDTTTKRGTESRGTFYDAKGRGQFEVESEGAFLTLAPHLRILTETHVFDRDGESSKRLKVAAAVAGNYVIKPKRDGGTAILSRARAARPDILDDEVATGQRPLQQREINARQQKVQEQRVQRTEARTEKRDADDVRNELFELFREVKFWTFKDLKERTQQPEMHLKAILADLCDFENFGENKGKYQIKEEYR